MFKLDIEAKPSLSLVHKTRLKGQEGRRNQEINDVSFTSTSSAYTACSPGLLVAHASHPSHSPIFEIAAPEGYSFRAARFVSGGEDGDLLYAVANASSRKSSDILVYDGSGSVTLSRRGVASRPVVSFAVSRCGEYLALATQDLRVMVLESRGLSVCRLLYSDVSVQTLVVYANRHAFPITSLVFTNDSMSLISGSADGSVLVNTVPAIKAGYGLKFAF